MKLATLAALVTLTMAVRAQGPLAITIPPSSASLSGSVRDESNNPVQATVTIATQGLRQSQLTTANGSFSFSNLKTGMYFACAVLPAVSTIPGLLRNRQRCDQLSYRELLTELRSQWGNSGTCTGFHVLSVASQANSRNGEFGLTSDGSLVYQLTEARIGTSGQQVNQFLDGPVGGNWMTATPWIWSTIQFGANGYTRSWVQGANLQIFPTYQVYTNSSPYTSFPESLANLMSFVALNSTSQYTGPSK